MKKLMHSMICLLLVILLLLPATAAFAAEESAAARPAAVTAEGFWEISKYGNVKLNLSHAQVLNAFDYGDILTVSFGGVSVDLPLCKAFADVDSGCTSLLLQMDGETEETELNINMGNFAETYGIAKKIVHEDKSFEWQYFDGMSDKTVFTITLKEKAGYLAEFTLRNMSYTDLREDYADLSDAEYANFRPVTAGEIGMGILYRSASPVDPEHHRSVYADAAAAAAGVTVFVDLTDNETMIAAYEGVEDSYFASQKHVAVAAAMDFTAQENTVKLAEALRFMAANPGVYDVFCQEGKDRTGVVVALLESLMGADYDEIAADYMLSYCNYYGVKPEDGAYDVTLNGNLKKNLTAIFGEDPEKADLRQAAEKYLSAIGLTEEEIAGLKTNLAGLPFDDAAPTDWSYADVAYVCGKGLMEGMGNGKFGGTENASRAMLTAILWRLDGRRYPDYYMMFGDVPAGAWYTEAIRWASAEKIAQGYSRFDFGPEDPLTREQLAAMLYRYARYKGWETSPHDGAELSAFSDSADVSDYAQDAMKWAVGCGLLQGSDGKLMPDGDATREQLAAVLHRFCELAGR